MSYFVACWNGHKPNVVCKSTGILARISAKKQLESYKDSAQRIQMANPEIYTDENTEVIYLFMNVSTLRTIFMKSSVTI